MLSAGLFQRKDSVKNILFSLPRNSLVDARRHFVLESGGGELSRSVV